MNNIIKRTWNQNRLVNIEDLTGMAFQAEADGHTFEISGADDTGAAVELSGTVSGVFRRPDNADIALTGSASDGVVSVTLSEDCYAVPGRFGLTIFVTSNSQKVAVYACVGTVAVSSTGNVAGDTPASVEDLIDDINAAIADLNSAIGQIPASYANVMAAIAPTYSSSALYPVGSYTWYDGALYRCITAIITAEAWDSTHWAKVSIGADVSILNNKFPIVPVETSFFNDLNYGVPQNVRFIVGKYPDANGKVTTNSGSSCDLIIGVEPNTTYYLYVPARNRQVVVESSDDIFAIGTTYTKLSVQTPFYHEGTTVLKFTTGQTAKYIMVYIYSGAYDYETNKNSIIMTANDFIPNIQPTIKKEFIQEDTAIIEPKQTVFFDGVNWFDPESAQLYTDRFANASGTIQAGSTVNSIVFPVFPNTTYWFFAPGMNRAFGVESSENIFAVGQTFSVVSAVSRNTPIKFTTGPTAKYVFMYFCSGSYDYESNKSGFVLNINQYISDPAGRPQIKHKYLSDVLSADLEDRQVLVFGDSITDTCNFTINSADETTAMTWKNPSNSYVDSGGSTITYSMWPKILKDSQGFAEIRNYARSGASYKSSTRQSGEERQNLQYQITVALNDRDNPHDVFDIDDFSPDIIIFALGTNDGAPNDTYESAMNKTVYQSDGVSIDVDATLLALDETKFCESARKAFIRVKQAFPMAQIFCVLPIQRANNEINVGTLHDYLKKMAERYGCIIIDGAFSSGITREFNVWNSLGEYLKDGLHPNEKGQNLMARMILSSLRTMYVPFGTGFNVLS